jgi:hypothetical protein
MNLTGLFDALMPACIAAGGRKIKLTPRRRSPALSGKCASTFGWPRSKALIASFQSSS